MLLANPALMCASCRLTNLLILVAVTLLLSVSAALSEDGDNERLVSEDSLSKNDQGTVDGILIIEVTKGSPGLRWRLFSAGWSQSLDTPMARELITAIYPSGSSERGVFLRASSELTIQDLLEVVDVLKSCDLSKFVLNDLIRCDASPILH